LLQSSIYSDLRAIVVVLGHQLESTTFRPAIVHSSFLSLNLLSFLRIFLCLLYSRLTQGLELVIFSFAFIYFKLK